jgi:hypothetical protein
MPYIPHVYQYGMVCTPMYHMPYMYIYVWVCTTMSVLPYMPDVGGGQDSYRNVT